MSVSVFDYTISEDVKENTAVDDIKAFEVLFKGYYVKLVFFANKFLNNMEGAEEIVSDTFTYLWEQKAEINITTSTNAYLYKMVQNRCLNYIKHKKIENEYVNYLSKNNLLADFYRTQSEPFLHKELQEQIGKAINELPERCREIFKMSRFEHLKNREIAEQLNISPKTVERQMTIALEKMRHYLQHLFLITAFFFTH